MYGTTVTSGGQEVAMYRCGSSMSNAACAVRQVRESVVVEKIVEVLEQTFLDPDNAERLEASLLRQQEERHAAAKHVAVDLQRRVTRLDADIAKAKKNLLLLDAEDIPAAKVHIREWEGQPAEAQAELARLVDQSPVQKLDRLIKKVRNLSECVRSADTSLARSLVRGTVGKVDLRFDAVPKAKVTRYPLAGGVLHVLPEDESAVPSSSCPAAGQGCRMEHPVRGLAERAAVRSPDNALTCSGNQPRGCSPGTTPRTPPRPFPPGAARRRSPRGLPHAWSCLPG
jgi:hypothetical protein